MVPARCLMLIDIYIKFREDSVNGFQVIEWIRFCDRQTDRETPRGKTICLPTLKGEDIINARIISKAHAQLRTMEKTCAKCQKDSYKTVRGVALTRVTHCLYIEGEK